MKEQMDKLLRQERFKAYFQIVLGCLIGGVAYPLFLVPNSIAPGGLTGVATVLNHLFGAPVGLTSMILNLPLFLMGYKAMGRVFVVRSLIATVLFSVFIDLFKLQPMTDDVLLGSIYGGVILGAGLGLILRGGATTGGSDMIARMVHKRFSFITVGMFLFMVDFMVVVLAGIFVGMKHALYALICIFISAKAVDVVIAGFSTVKACYIITRENEKVAQRIMNELERGVTILTATGAYSGQKRPVLLCVAGSAEIARIKSIVHTEDETAFMFITGAHEALGEGFSKLGGEG